MKKERRSDLTPVLVEVSAEASAEAQACCDAVAAVA